ncbi:DUF397 domain-containing protein [Sphaerisporangium sp. NPDC051017]|uniref:DUF397 domain-containing protein n=1 Tax=Sphaerisporangium sp. NPDC051017 TaxID=3154636 RepID=UPI003417F31E
MNELTSVQWVKSSYSGSTGDCLEVAALSDSGMAVRDSKRPHGLALRLRYRMGRIPRQPQVR